MDDRILSTFLDAGLLELKGQDAWFEHITRAADQLAIHLAEHPHELAGFVYSAIDPTDREGDPARAMALETLKSVWRTFSSVSIGPLDTVLRGVLLDAVVQNANQDPQTKLALTLLLSSALPYIELGAEARVWQTMLDELVQEIEADAEAKWSVPTEVELPSIPEFDVPSLSGRLGGIKIDENAIVAGMYKAVGPTDDEGQQTGGNPQWPNTNDTWAKKFASLSAEVISEGLQKVAGARNYTLKADELANTLREMVEAYIGLAAGRLTAASHGVDLRSRLLWWKEAKVSPSARVEYRLVPTEVVPGLMAFDYQQMLPPLAPASVIAFLRETVRSITDETPKTTLADYLMALSKASEFVGYREHNLSDEDTYRPLATLVAAGVSDAETINHRTVFSAEATLSPHDFSVLLFIELQATKAIEGITPRVLETEEEQDEEAPEVEESE